MSVSGANDISGVDAVTGCILRGLVTFAPETDVAFIAVQAVNAV
jgi:hypothetical protein